MTHDPIPSYFQVRGKEGQTSPSQGCPHPLRSRSTKGKEELGTVLELRQLPWETAGDRRKTADTRQTTDSSQQSPAPRSRHTVTKAWAPTPKEGSSTDEEFCKLP